MVHGEEEVEQAVVRRVQGAVYLGRYVGRDAVRGEDGVDDGRGRGGRRLDELSCFADGGFVRFTVSVSIITTVATTIGAKTYASLFAPAYPPNPIDIAPAVNSANPPRTTTLEFPSADSPALSANGTVNPSDIPRIASDTIRGLMRARPLLLLLLLSSCPPTESSSSGGFRNVL